MNPDKPMLLVTIDTECDKSPSWHTAAPLTFRGVTEGIPNLLQPVFETWGIRPTYLLSPEVILDLECREVLAGLKNVELGAHLHGDYIAPQLKTWDLAGTITDEMQWEYSPDLEREKLETLTHLFRQQFDTAPRSFRAGRFGIGHQTGRWLQELGYRVDSSVTPHVVWTSRHREPFPDFRDLPEFPYQVGAHGDIWKPGSGALLEVPVTILKPGTIAAPQAQDPIWFRPWYSGVETLLETLEWVAAQPPQDGHRRPLVMMFHNVEVIPGASPYPQTPADVHRYLDALKRVFARAEEVGLRPATLSEYAQDYERESAGRPSGEGKLRGQTQARRPEQSFSPGLRLSPQLVEAALARHNAPAWFGYIFRERATRWDVWKPCVWIARNYSPEARILSTGCGVGFNLFWLADHGFRELYGFDIDPSTIAAARELSERTGYPLHLWTDDGLQPGELPAEKFDVIEALNWTYLLDEYGLDEFLDRYLPHLSEAGALILDAIDSAYNQVPNNQYLTSDWQKPEFQRKPSEYKVRISQEQIRYALEARGFQLVEVISEEQIIPKRVYIAARATVSGRFTAGSNGGLSNAEQMMLPATPDAPITRPRVLLIADVPNWIFERHCRTLVYRLSADFDFTLKFMNEPYDEAEYDLIYPLEWYLVRPEWIHSPQKYVTGIRSHDSWRQYAPADFARFLATHFGRVHVVSQRLYEIFKPLLPGVVYVTHGVDTDFFTPTQSVRPTARKLRLGWAGNRLKAMSPANKGFAEFIEPLGRLPGVELVFCGYSDRNLTMEEMRAFYDSIDAYICASQFEGSNNSLLEAAAMERAIVTTDNGTVPEYLIHQRSALVVPRQLPEFIKAVEFLRDHPKKRLSLGKAARMAVAAGWDWKTRVEDYRRFFLEALAAAGWNGPAKTTASLDAFLRLAEACFASGDLAGSAQHLAAALELAPDSPELILAHGNILLRQGNTEGARRAFVKATVLAPSHAPAFLNLAAVQALLGQSVAALATVRQALALQPDHLEALKLLGRLCLESGDYFDGVSAYLGVLQQNPKDVETLLALGACYAAVDDPESAGQLYRQVLQLDPGNSTARAALEGLGCSSEPAEAAIHPEDNPVVNPAKLKKAGTPLVSVIVPTYNRPEMLVEAIQSILNQTFQDFEILVVNDAGVDVHPQVEALNQNGKIIYLAHRDNRGLGAARNTGIRNARGRYIAYLDDDDRFYPHHLETLVSFLEGSNYEVAYTDAYQAHQRRENGRYVTFQKVLAFSHEFDPDVLLVQNYTPVLCVMHTRRCALEAGLFDETLSVYEDWDLWIRISRNYPFAHLPQVTCEFTWRVDGSTMSSSRDGFQSLLPVIYERYQAYAQGNPQVLEAQSRFLHQAEQIMRQRAALRGLEEIFSYADRDAAIEAYRDRLTVEMLEILHQAADRERQAGNLSKGDELEAVARGIRSRLPDQACGSPLGIRDFGRQPAGSIPVDIVIPVYGQPHLVRRCVDSVLRTVSGAFSIILVDDASPDAMTRRLLEAYVRHPAIQVICRATNAGFIAASRQGAQAGSAPFILFLNSDIEAVEPGWLEKMIPATEDVAVVGARLLFPPDVPGPLAGTVQHAGVARLRSGVPFHPFLGQPAGHPAANQQRELNAVTGACFLVRRRVWEELGGWDERFGRGVFEDIDFCWQARQRGYRILYEPAACLYHHESASRELDGAHKLHAHSQDNLERLKGKWSFLASDEELFVGKKEFKRYEQARAWMRKARAALDRKRLPDVMAATRRAYKLAPELPEAVIGYGQLLALQGEHVAAAEKFEQAVRLDPKNWPVWMRLIDEWQIASQPERAAGWLIQLLAMFPDDPQVLERKARLSAWLPAGPRTPVQPGPSLGSGHRVESRLPAPESAPGRQTASRDGGDLATATLAALLEADDLPAALQVHADRLDPAVLALVQQEAEKARISGETELAEGLDGLAEYVRETIEARAARVG